MNFYKDYKPRTTSVPNSSTERNSPFVTTKKNEIFRLNNAYQADELLSGRKLVLNDQKVISFIKQQKKFNFLRFSMKDKSELKSNPGYQTLKASKYFQEMLQNNLDEQQKQSIIIKGNTSVLRPLNELKLEYQQQKTERELFNIYKENQALKQSIQNRILAQQEKKNLTLEQDDNISLKELSPNKKQQGENNSNAQQPSYQQSIIKISNYHLKSNIKIISSQLYQSQSPSSAGKPSRQRISNNSLSQKTNQVNQVKRSQSAKKYIQKRETELKIQEIIRNCTNNNILNSNFDIVKNNSLQNHHIQPNPNNSENQNLQPKQNSQQPKLNNNYITPYSNNYMVNNQLKNTNRPQSLQNNLQAHKNSYNSNSNSINKNLIHNTNNSTLNPNNENKISQYKINTELSQNGPENQNNQEYSDISIDSDEDEEENEDYADIPINSQQITHMAEVHKKKAYKLLSVYDKRPHTLYFPYPIQSEIQKPLSSRVQGMDKKEESQCELRYKIITYGEAAKCISTVLELGGLEYQEEGEVWNICWGLGKQTKVRQLCKYQKINHFPGCFNLGRKDFLWRHMSRSKRKFPKDFDFIPNTYLLSSSSDWERFQTMKQKAERNHLWIMKPTSASQGKGIKMISKRSRVQKKRDYLISEYVAEPHLINGLKYDLRIYVVVTSYSPLRIYLFEEGLTRFATEKYTSNLNQLTKRYVHLTNYSVNKNSKNFFKNKDSHVDNIGNKWSLTAWKREITRLGIDIENLMNKISDVIIKTLISAEPYMLDMHSKSPEHKNNCFELYGFDILIDNQMKPWLLEVNVRPSLSSSSPLDRRIKHTLMCDMMNLIGILPYNKRAYEEEKKKKIPGYNDQTKRNFSKNINDIQDLDHENCFQKLTQEDWLYLFETDEEFYRKGHFARIYPTPDTQKMEYYMNFFEYPRYNNIVVQKWITGPYNYLEKILPKISQESI